MHRLPRMVFLGLFAIPLMLTGCGGGTAEKPAARTEKTVTPEQLLQGQWHGQMVLDEEIEKQLPPAQVEKLKSMTMGMEFQPDGKLILAGIKDDGKPYESQAAWKVLEAKDDQITIQSVETSGKATDAVLMFESDDSFLMPLKTEVANLGAMRFERLR